MINIISPINQLGYGITGLNITKSLSSLTNVALWTIGQPEVTNNEDASIIKNCIRNNQFPKFDAPCIRIWHQHDMSQFVGKGLRIGFPIFELDKFNDIEKHHLGSLDKIFVCSDWAKGVILNNINISENNVHVVPLGVDIELFKPSLSSVKDRTVFFNCGKWEIRKGHDVLVELFNKAFDTTDDVELILMCDNPFLSPQEAQEWESLYKYSKLGDKITIIHRQDTQQEVYNIMRNCHCGVFPSRAEGWNLELLEMLACGKHVITTEYAAHTQFCNQENAYLTPITQYEPAQDGKWFHGQGNWAKLGQDQKNKLIQDMRHIHSLRKENNLFLNENGVNTAKNFTWSNSAKKILEYIA
jgi:glycosyltransferase involved in cell wall biosynthesis